MVSNDGFCVKGNELSVPAIVIFYIKFIPCENNFAQKLSIVRLFVCLFVFLALQPTVVVFSQPGSGL